MENQEQACTNQRVDEINSDFKINTSKIDLLDFNLNTSQELVAQGIASVVTLNNAQASDVDESTSITMGGSNLDVDG